jgi:thioredoxin reductase
MMTGLGRVTEVDLAVVGAGPAGLYAAYYSGFRGFRTAIIDALPEAGGQVSAMYPEKLIFDVAGFREVRGRDLVSALVDQADRFGPSYHLGVAAVAIQHERDGKVVISLSDGTRVRTAAVVVTGGIGSFSPRPLPAAADFEGRGLVFFVPRLDDMTDKDVVIVGGGDSAFDWAQSLEPIARSVTLVHRRGAFRAHAGTVKAVQESRVEIITDAQITAVAGQDGIETVTISHGATKETSIHKCQALVAALGFTADLGHFEAWGMSIVDRHIVVDTTMATGVPGVFAAGDITDYPGKVRLISVGFGEAATAVNNAASLIDPEATVFPGHSTDS